MNFRIMQVFLFSTLLMICSSASYAESLMCKVDKIIDIKTIICVQPNNEDDLLIKNTVSLDKIDTVRIGQQPFFFQARDLMNQLMEGQLIFIDVKESNEKYKEIYAEQPPYYKRRIRGVVYASDVNVNLKLVEKGFATVAVSDEKIDNAYYQAQSQAKNNKRGLWSANPVITPRQFDDNWRSWQKELPKILKTPEVVECQVEKITNTEQFYCYYQDENRLNVQDHIGYYQIWMPPIWSIKNPYGDQAENALKKLMDNKKVTVYVYQIKSDSIYPRETIQRYRDVTGTVYIDGKNLIEELLKEGLAATYPSKEWPENPTYIALQNKAVQEKKGMWASKEVSDFWFSRYERAEKQKMNDIRNLKISYAVVYAFPVLLFILICWIFVKVRVEIALFMLVIPLVAISFPVYIFLSSSAIIDTGSWGISEAAGIKIALLVLLGGVGAISIIPTSLTIGGIVIIVRGAIKRKSNQVKEPK